MLVSHTELCEFVRDRVIHPVEPKAINAASIDVRLGGVLLIESYNDADSSRISLKDRTPLSMHRVDISDSHYDLRPGEFVLASTVEQFNLPNNIAAEFKLKSSGARIGLNNMLATWCDPGWHGSVLTLEIHNVTNWHTIRLHPGDYIGQMIFHKCKEVSASASYAARGRYNGDTTVTGVKE